MFYVAIHSFFRLMREAINPAVVSFLLCVQQHNVLHLVSAWYKLPFARFSKQHQQFHGHSRIVCNRPTIVSHEYAAIDGKNDSTNCHYRFYFLSSRPFNLIAFLFKLVHRYPSTLVAYRLMRCMLLRACNELNRTKSSQHNGTFVCVRLAWAGAQSANIKKRIARHICHKSANKRPEV